MAKWRDEEVVMLGVLRLPCRSRELGGYERRLAELLDLERTSALTLEGLLLESFDGRLARDGGLIERRGDASDTELVWTDLDLIGDRGRILPAPLPPITAPDLPAGPVRDRLAAVLGDRALLPVGRLRRRRHTWERRDPRGKVILRVVCEHHVEFDPEDGEPKRPLPAQIHVEGLRGYETAFETARATIGSLPGLTVDPTPWGEVLLREAGRIPAQDPSELALDLQPDHTAVQGYCRTFAALLAVLEVNSAGAAAALDVEFLHDLRVSIRRTRVLLSASEQVLPEPLRRHVATEFKWLGGETIALRDLDVNLLHFDDFVARAPRVDASELAPLRALLEELQREERRRVAQALSSERAQTLFDSWRKLLTSESEHEGETPDAHRPLALVAVDRVRRAERRVLSLGRRIDRDTPDEQLHELRKRGKKLRYLLEFFGSALDEPATKARIVELKALQNHLGEHQDRVVQIAALRAYAQVLQHAPPACLLAMGFLVERLDEERRHCRAEFANRFAAYDEAEPRRHFRRALKRVAVATADGDDDLQGSP